MEVSSDQRIIELCKQVIETDTPLDQMQMPETGDEREKLIAAVRDKVAKLFFKKERAVDYWDDELRRRRGILPGGIVLQDRETSLPDMSPPQFSKKE